MKSKGYEISHYWICQKGKENQVFTDATEAGKAWNAAEMATTSHVIAINQNGSGRNYAGVYTHWRDLYKSVPEEFRASFDQAERQAPQRFSIAGKGHAGPFYEAKSRCFIERLSSEFNDAWMAGSNLVFQVSADGAAVLATSELIARADRMSKEMFLALRDISDSMERTFAKGQGVDEGFDARLVSVSAVLNAAPWTNHPEYGCVLIDELPELDRAVEAYESVFGGPSY